MNNRLYKRCQKILRAAIILSILYLLLFYKFNLQFKYSMPIGLQFKKHVSVSTGTESKNPIYETVQETTKDDLIVVSKINENHDSDTENKTWISSSLTTSLNLKIKENSKVNTSNENTSMLSTNKMSTSQLAILSTANEGSEYLNSKVLDIVTANDGKSTFSKLLEELDWNMYEKAVTTDNIASQAYLQKLILQLSHFLAMEPIVPINPNCKPQILEPPESIDCTKYPSGFTGNRNSNLTKTKIGILIHFGFDVDVLEIYLNEMYDVVDQFFIIESTKTHRKTLAKPLMWEKVQFQPRFNKFLNKITHFVVDDAQNANATMATGLSPGSEKIMWLMELLQETLRWEKFLEWNNVYHLFNDDDVLGFGDADEIPSRKMVNMIKYCELKDGRVDFGIWFPFGNIKLAFSTDHPIKGYPYTFGDPAYWTLKTGLEFSKNTGKVPSKTYGRSKNFLLGGIHMTHYGYLPFQLVKRITVTDGIFYKSELIQKVSSSVTVKDIKKLELELGAAPKQHRHRIVNLMRDIAILPWFYDCNRDRYPVWEGKHDTRLYLPIQTFQ